jgi:hypothetical protein
MRRAPITSRCSARRLAPALALLAIAAPAATPAQAASWRLEPIAASTGVAELHELAFDARGHALLSWNGAEPSHDPPVFLGLATRDTNGTWGRPTDLRGIVPTNAQVHLSGTVNALLVAREATSATSTRRLITASGQSDGGFDAFGSLDEFVSNHWSAVNPAGDAIVAWTVERSPFLRVAERKAGQPFAAARDLALGKTAAVAINARGDHVLVWRAGTRLAARFRPAGGEWSSTQRFGRVQTIAGLRLSALLVRNGRVIVTWGRVGRPCGVAIRNGAGTWTTRTLEQRCGRSGAESREAPVQPVADEKGATYVAWTGRTRTGRQAVKFARIGAHPSRTPLVISRQRGAVLDDIAAGPGGALAITYTAPQPTPKRPLLFATFAALRREGATFARADRLTPTDVFVAQGSRVAFQPLTGEPLVAVPFLVGRTVAVAAAVGPPAPSP